MDDDDDDDDDGAVFRLVVRLLVGSCSYQRYSRVGTGVNDEKVLWKMVP